MAKLKALPKALIVAAIVGGVGFAAYKFMPHKTKEDAEIVQNDPAELIKGKAEVQKQIDEDRQRDDAPVLTAAEPEHAAPTGKLPGAGIASGQKTGTNWPMTQDIVKACNT
ncbi:hypothetical protein, partial [Acinetobacter sp.]|uniref:hypothetical protein n=1 Tax=Acinetobacter sp. TaxID=472 RepID=UPI00388F0BB5